MDLRELREAALRCNGHRPHWCIVVENGLQRVGIFLILATIVVKLLAELAYRHAILPRHVLVLLQAALTRSALPVMVLASVLH